MAKKADNIFVRAKAYRKLHPRTSFQDAIQKVKGKKVSGVKATVTTKPKPRTGNKRGNSTGPSTVHTGTLTISGTRKRSTAKKVGSSRDENAELLSAFLRIDRYEEMLRAEKRKGVKAELINKINSLHDKVDRLKARAIH